MSSDDEMYRGPSLNYPPQPSTGGLGTESPNLDNPDDVERRGSLNGNNYHENTTANDVANSDERVRQVLYSDVRSVPIARLMRVDWSKCALKSTEAGCSHLQGILFE